jgi:hypothetical protein
MNAFTTIEAGEILFTEPPGTKNRIIQVIENKAGTIKLTALTEEIEEAANNLGLEIDSDIVDGATLAALLNWLDEEDLLEKI